MSVRSALSEAQNSMKINSSPAKSLCNAVEELVQVWMDCKIAHICGTTAGIMGGILTIGGGDATVASSEIVLPLLSIGMGFGLASAVTNLGTSTVEGSISATKIRKPEKDSKETLDSASNVKKIVNLWLDRQEKTRLLFICFHALQTMRAGGKLAGGLTIGISAAFLFLDAKVLHYTMRDFYSVENKGSETSTLLRQKASNLDQIN